MVWLFPFFFYFLFKPRLLKMSLAFLLLMFGQNDDNAPSLSLKLVIIFLVRFDWGEQGVWGSSKLDGLTMWAVQVAMRVNCSKKV